MWWIQADPKPCNYSDTHFLAAGGLPGAPIPITNPADGRAATGAYIPNQTLPYSETWTAGVQHIFANKYTLEVRYVGTRGIHLSVQTRLNRRCPGNAYQQPADVPVGSQPGLP